MNSFAPLERVPLLSEGASGKRRIFEASHPDIVFVDGRFLRLLKLDARVDEDQYHSIDLAEFWLPSTSVHAKPLRLTDRPELVAVVVAVIDKYHHRVKRSKSRHRRAASMVKTLLKFFEYLWLNDIYKLDSATPEDFERLASLLGQGDWHKALDFSRRLELSFNAPDRVLVSSILGLPRNRLRALMGDEVRKAIGSNLSSQEAAQNLQSIYDVLKNEGFSPEQSVKLAEGDSSGMGESLLRQTFDTLNYLLDLPSDLGLRFEPYPDAFKRSKSLGRPGSRTRNLGALEAGLLLNEAYQWLYIYGPLVSDLVAGACMQVKAAHAEGRAVLGHNLEEWLESSPIRKTLEGYLGLPIEQLDGGDPSKLSLRRLLLSTFTACFVLTAVMNARRRDEITHRKFGLHRGCIQVRDEELGIFTGAFFIEKTYQTYLEFYVNKTTWHAIQLLEKFQASFDDLAMAMGRPVLDDFPEKERSLFGYFPTSPRI